ncbi:MAG: YkgJ family cysteine cluster protein [Deltaproteobacteria bacterium]|nr:YkgJ family cysteine cluster protein [Deltaproteobacteria bacterium]
MKSGLRHDLDALRSLFQEADRLLAGWGCPERADCCHFARTGREPYLWANEWALLQMAISSRGLRHRSLLAVRRADLACPLLGTNGRCTVYSVRPLGCRTFFCEKGVGPLRRRPRDQLMEIGRRISDLARKEDPTSETPRPLSRWLEDWGKRRPP